MASTSISGASINDYLAYFQDGGTLPSGAIAASAIPMSKLKYQKITGTAHTSAVTTATHGLGQVPSVVIPVSRTSGVGVQTTGTHTSTHVLGIVADGNATSFEIYVFA